MEGLPESFFNFVEWDGKTAATNRLVCKQWKASIERTPKLRHLIRMHHVLLDHIKDIKLHLGPLKRISQLKAAQHFSEILYRKLGINPFMCGLGQYEGVYYNHGKIMYSSLIRSSILTKSIVAPDTLFSKFGWRGESGAYFMHQVTGDIVILNNFYNSVKSQYGITDKAMESLRWLEREAMPDTIIWKFFYFPKLLEQDYIVYSKGFHRGCSFCIIVKNPYGPMLPKKKILPELRKISRKRKTSPNELEERIIAEIRKNPRNQYQ